jgi:hypothetical protein
MLKGRRARWAGRQTDLPSISAILWLSRAKACLAMEARACMAILSYPDVYSCFVLLIPELIKRVKHHGKLVVRRRTTGKFGSCPENRAMGRVSCAIGKGHDDHNPGDLA